METIDSSTTIVTNEKASMLCGAVDHNIQSRSSYLEGRILTFVEIALPEGQQLNALKGQIKELFRDHINETVMSSREMIFTALR